MGKNGAVFVINPPLLRASQASSGSATITATPVGPAVPHPASLAPAGARSPPPAGCGRGGGRGEGRAARERGREGGGEGTAIRGGGGGGGESSLPQLARRMGVRGARPPRGVTAAAELARRGTGARRF